MMVRQPFLPLSLGENRSVGRMILLFVQMVLSIRPSLRERLEFEEWKVMTSSAISTFRAFTA
jgi:hypothetical protein